MKLLVCGSRDWTDRDAIADALRPYYDGETPVVVLHGGARGADKLAEGVARAFGFATEEFQAAWRTEGKRAGILRNLRMLDEWPDKVIAFHLNGSRGTQHTIDEARKRGIPVEVHEEAAECWPSKQDSKDAGCTCQWWGRGAIVDFDPGCPILDRHRPRDSASNPSAR